MSRSVSLRVFGDQWGKFALVLLLVVSCIGPVQWSAIYLFSMKYQCQVLIKQTNKWNHQWHGMPYQLGAITATARSIHVLRNSASTSSRTRIRSSSPSRFPTIVGLQFRSVIELLFLDLEVVFLHRTLERMCVCIVF